MWGVAVKSETDLKQVPNGFETPLCSAPIVVAHPIASMGVKAAALMMSRLHGRTGSANGKAAAAAEITSLPAFLQLKGRALESLCCRIFRFHVRKQDAVWGGNFKGVLLCAASCFMLLMSIHLSSRRRQQCKSNSATFENP